MEVASYLGAASWQSLCSFDGATKSRDVQTSNGNFHGVEMELPMETRGSTGKPAMLVSWVRAKMRKRGRLGKGEEWPGEFLIFSAYLPESS
jgi:hypothetical protein